MGQQVCKTETDSRLLWRYAARLRAHPCLTYWAWTLSEARPIMADRCFPLFEEFQLLPSGRRSTLPRSRTDKKKKTKTKTLVSLLQLACLVMPHHTNVFMLLVFYNFFYVVGVICFNVLFICQRWLKNKSLLGDNKETLNLDDTFEDTPRNNITNRWIMYIRRQDFLCKQNIKMPLCSASVNLLL